MSEGDDRPKSVRSKLTSECSFDGISFTILYGEKSTLPRALLRSVRTLKTGVVLLMRKSRRKGRQA